MSVNLVFDGATMGDLGAALRAVQTQQAALGTEMQRLQGEMGNIAQQLWESQQQSVHDGLAHHNVEPGAHEGRLTAIEGRLALSEGRLATLPNDIAERLDLQGLVATALEPRLNRAQEVLMSIVNALSGEMNQQLAEQRAVKQELSDAVAAQNARVQELGEYFQAQLLPGLQNAVSPEVAARVSGLETAVGELTQHLGETRVYLDQLGFNTPAPPPGIGHSQAQAVADHRIAVLEQKVTSLELKLASDNGGGHSLGKDEPIKALEVFSGDGKKDTLTFEKVRAVFRDQVALRDRWKGALEFAEQASETVDDTKTDEHWQRLSTELWSVLGYKLSGDAWAFRRTIREGNGLELWRALCYEYDRKTPGRAAAIKKALLAVDVMKGPDDVRKTIEMIEHGTQTHNKMGSLQIRDEEKHSFLIRTVPHEFMQQMLMNSIDINTYSSLKERLLLWSRGDKDWRLLAAAGSAHSTAMDLGAVSSDKAAVTPDPFTTKDPWKEAVQPQGPPEQSPLAHAVMQKLDEFLGAVGVGKGGQGGKGGKGDGKCFICKGDHFVRYCPQNPDRVSGGDKGGKAKGSPKGGKGDGKGKGLNRRQGWGICNAFRKYGSCNKPGCPYAHVKVPAQLSSCEGLVLQDLGTTRFDGELGCFVVVGDIDCKSIHEAVEAEMAALNNLSEYEGFQGQPF